MKKISFLFFFFISISNVFSQFEKIQSFQRDLIENEVTASNVALVFKDGDLIKSWMTLDHKEYLGEFF